MSVQFHLCWGGTALGCWVCGPFHAVAHTAMLPPLPSHPTCTRAAHCPASMQRRYRGAGGQHGAEQRVPDAAAAGAACGSAAQGQRGGGGAAATAGAAAAARAAAAAASGREIVIEAESCNSCNKTVACRWPPSLQMTTRSSGPAQRRHDTSGQLDLLHTLRCDVAHLCSLSGLACWCLCSVSMRCIVDDGWQCAVSTGVFTACTAPSMSWAARWHCRAGAEASPARAP